MHKHFALSLLLSIGLILNCSRSHSAASSRRSNANGNVFNLLLGLYKINPLKGSQVFQSFSTNLLKGMGRGNKNDFVLTVESGESVKVDKQVKTSLKEIEKMIHTKNKKPAKGYEKPAYDLDDVSTENFKTDLVYNDRVLSKEDFQITLQDNNNNKEDFSALFEHIGSNEIDTDVPVTKLLPVNDTIIRYSRVSNQNDTVVKLPDKTGKIDNHIGALAKVHDRNQGGAQIDNFAEGMEDVIVL